MQNENEYLRWWSYLLRLSEEPVNLSKQHARSVAVVWAKLSGSVCQSISPPIAGPGGEFGFQLAWKGDHYYMDIDIAETGCFHWYFKDMNASESDGSEDPVYEPPEALIRLLVQYCLVL